jgi:hypothetical protein
VYAPETSAKLAMNNLVMTFLPTLWKWVEVLGKDSWWMWDLSQNRSRDSPSSLRL